jgi:small subunit ribosomal protein S20
MSLEEYKVANIKSAKKRAVQSELHRKRNTSAKSAYRTYIKKVEAAIVANKKEDAIKALKEATPIIDKMAAKRILDKNKAARHKSRLNAKIKNMA